MTNLECKLVQGFGGNITATYIKGGLLGHPGDDEACGYGSPIHFKHESGYCYKVLTVENPARDGSGYTGAFFIIDNGIEVLEVTYGHCDPLVTVGQICHQGDVIGTEANHGEVYVGTTRITLEMQKEGDKRGNHRHYQERILKKVTTWDNKLQGRDFLSTPFSDTAYFKDGYYYKIPYYINGFNGCRNPLLPLFNRDLYLGRSGYDVLCLQNFLKARGFLNIENTTDFYGTLTLKTVMAFQKANGISPIGGYAGKITLALINNLIK